MPKFSIIIPTYNRREQVIQAVKSVQASTYDPSEIEIVIVDDGSTDGTESALGLHFGVPISGIVYVKHETNLGKTFARNTGLRAATGEWISWLDSDDEYHSHYHSTFAKLIEENPDTKIFTCGAAVYNHKNRHFSTRPAFVPKEGERFKSGQIGAGSFLFHRSIGAEIPESRHPYGGEGSFSQLVQSAVPGIRDLYGMTESGQWPPLGNPFGDDYVAFFLMTRTNQPVGVNLPLYIQDVRP